MSSPDSTIAVETSMSAWPVTNFTIAASSSRSRIWPCAMTTRAPGTMPWTNSPIDGSDCDAVVHEEDLAPAARARARALPRCPFLLKRRTTVSTGRRSMGGVSITDMSRTPDQRHVERARDRGRGEREHVDGGAQLLHALLVGHAEAVLLVDHEQPEVLELDVLREEAVGADHHVHGALLDALDDGLLLLGDRKRESSSTRAGKRREAVGERRPVLLGEHGRRARAPPPEARPRPP